MKYLIILALMAPTAVDAGIKAPPLVIQALKKASASADVPYRLIASICYIESSLRPHVRNKYDGGSPSYGLCQIKEATARDMGFMGSVKELYDPFVNALYAAKYLRYQLDRYDGDWVRALAAYNRGSSGAHVDNSNYVHKVMTIAIQL